MWDYVLLTKQALILSSKKLSVLAVRSWIVSKNDIYLGKYFVCCICVHTYKYSDMGYLCALVVNILGHNW